MPIKLTRHFLGHLTGGPKSTPTWERPERKGRRQRNPT